ncbi:MAG: type I phosphomannose isomerase catalytic subunit [Planctomycetota bacterium]
MAEPYPLTFEPILMEKVWGGRRLASYGKALPDGVRIGESWELADLDASSLSGAGGGAQRSVIFNGPFAGRTLFEAEASWGERLFGRASPTPQGGFPLLVKLLDASENLSVQVHPPESEADGRDSHAKHECWYVLAAEPGSVIYKGLKPGVTRAELRDAIEAGRVPEVLASVPAVPGEMHDVPSGTLHAIGAGVVIAEIQTPSDTTYRVYDWSAEHGRTPREMHIEQALRCADFAPPPPVRSGEILCDNAFFRVREVRGHCEERPLGTGCQVAMIVGGSGASIASRASSFAEVEGGAGTTILVPASCADDAVLRAGPGTVCLVAELV